MIPVDHEVRGAEAPGGSFRRSTETTWGEFTLPLLVAYSGVYASSKSFIPQAKDSECRASFWEPRSGDGSNI